MHLRARHAAVPDLAPDVPLVLRAGAAAGVRRSQPDPALLGLCRRPRGFPPPIRAQTYVDANGDGAQSALRRRAARSAERRHRRPRRRGHLLGQRDGGHDRSPFQQRLEATPHGAVHCAIVNGRMPERAHGLGARGGPRSDLLSHHANIDRLYECWLRVDRTRACPPAGPSSTQLFLRRRGRQRHPAAGPRHADHQPDPLQLFRRRRRLPAGPAAPSAALTAQAAPAPAAKRWRRRRAPAGSS